MLNGWASGFATYGAVDSFVTGHFAFGLVNVLIAAVNFAVAWRYSR